MSNQHEIWMGYRIDAMPANMNTQAVLRHLIHVVQEQVPLIPAVRVTWIVRGSERDFGEVLETANKGLLKLIERRLMRDLQGGAK